MWYIGNINKFDKLGEHIVKIRKLFILVLMFIAGGKDIFSACAAESMVFQSVKTPCCCSGDTVEENLPGTKTSTCCTTTCQCSVRIPTPIVPGISTTVVIIKNFRVLAAEAAPLQPSLYTQSTLNHTPERYCPVLPRSSSCPLHLRI